MNRWVSYLLTILLGYCSVSLMGQQFSQMVNLDFSDSSIQFIENSNLKAATDHPFAAISLFIEEENISSKFEIRFKYAGAWSEWYIIDEFAEGYTPGKTTFWGPMVSPGFSSIELSINRLIPQSVYLRLFYPDGNIKDKSEIKTDIKTEPGCGCKNPSFCSRACWCPSGDCTKTYTPIHTKAKHIIIHHSAGQNTSGNFAAVVSAYWDFHVNTNGWDDIGYNWLIDPNGVIYEGREAGTQGAHFSCMNSQTEGICIIGNYESINLSSTAEESLLKLLASQMCTFNLDPLDQELHESSELVLPTISGHLDGNNSPASHSCSKGTVCPGKNIYDLLPALRVKVSEFLCLEDTNPLDDPQYKSLNYLEVYPNPTTGSFNIHVDFREKGGRYQIYLTDILGRRVFQKTGIVRVNEMKILVDNLNLASGLLHLSLSTELETVSKTIVIRK